MLQPSETDAVLGGNSPPLISSVVLGGIEGLKRRYKEYPLQEIESEIAELTLLPALYAHFEQRAPIKVISMGAMRTQRKRLTLHDVKMWAPRSFTYGDSIAINEPGWQVGSLVHQGILFGDRVKFLQLDFAQVVAYPDADRPIFDADFKRACQKILAAALQLIP